MSNKPRNLTTAPLYSAIIRMAGGMIVGMLAISAFNTADTYFVGKLGVQELAAMSFTFPIVMILNSISLGIGTGLSSTVSRAIGAGDTHRVKRLTTDGLILALLIVIIISICGISTIRPLFRLLGADGNSLNLIEDYMFIWYIGFPFVVIPMAGNNVIRATGNTLVPSMIMASSVIVNICLDPMLIFGIGPFPEMGIAGAALATVFARFLTLLLSLGNLIFREKLISAEKPVLVETLENWKQILFVGIPAALVRAINPLSLGIITRLLSMYGEKVVAGFGAASRIEMVLLLIPMSFAAVMTPFAGQNWGAGKVPRIKKALHFTSLLSVSWGVIIFVLFIFIAESVLGLFSSNPEIIRVGSAYIRIMAFGYGFLGIFNISAQSFNAINKPLQSAAISLLKAFAVNVPLALLGSKLWQETGIFAASFLANIFAGILGFLLLQSFLQRTEKHGSGYPG